MSAAESCCYTGDDARFGPAEDAEGRHFLTRAGAAGLASHDPALAGIDVLNIDDTADGERPAHPLLLAAGIPVVEHLTGLEQLPSAGAWPNGTLVWCGSPCGSGPARRGPGSAENTTARWSSGSAHPPWVAGRPRRP